MSVASKVPKSLPVKSQRTMKVKTLRFSKKRVSRTKLDKKVKVRYTKQDYVQLLGEADKWPLSLRIAAELWRGGVTVDMFEQSYSLEGFGLNRDIYEHLVNFHLGKGYDPERVTPVRPVYLRYVPPVRALENSSNSRITSFDSVCSALRRIYKQGKEHGLKDVTFIQAIEHVEDEIDPPKKPIKVSSSKEDELEDTKIIVKNKNTFCVLVGNEWREAKTKEMALRLKEEEKHRQDLAPVTDPKTHCVWCKFPLKGTVVHTRDDGREECMHLGCFWMNAVPQSDIPIGMRILSAAEGAFYVWKGMPKKVKTQEGEVLEGGWQKDMPIEPKSFNENKTEKTDSSGNAEKGIPTPSGKTNKPTKAIPAKTAKKKSVSNVRKTSKRRK